MYSKFLFILFVSTFLAQILTDVSIIQIFHVLQRVTAGRGVATRKYDNNGRKNRVPRNTPLSLTLPPEKQVCSQSCSCQAHRLQSPQIQQYTQNDND